MNTLLVRSAQDEPTRPGRLASKGSGRRVQGDLENAARSTIDLRAGRVLTDPEWARARATILDFVAILRRWEQEARTNECAQCEREAA